MQDLRHFSMPQPQATRKARIIAMLNGIRKESVITSVLLIVIIVVFVWAFGPWQGRHVDESTRGAETITAVRAAESFGFTSVRITKTRRTGGALSPCDENDSTVHEAVATNLRDRETSLLICCNSTNDCTVKARH